jgi:hypothetical protein
MEDEVKKAIKTVQKAGYSVVSPKTIIQEPIISDLSNVLEKAGYRIDEAKIERIERYCGLEATGRITFTVVALDKFLITK